MIYSHILYEKKPDHTVLITLNRPEKRNPLIPQLREELLSALKIAEGDEDIKVIVLTGAGKAFSAGGDIENFAKRFSKRSQSKRPFPKTERIGAWGSEIARIDKPIIAAINGVAAGGGISVALLCDIRIASDQAKFITSFTKMGLIPDIGLTYLLPKVIGTGKALELFYTAGTIDANEAYQLALINKLVPHEKLIPEALALASKIAKGPQIAIRMIKRTVFKDIVTSLIGQIELESVMQHICFSTEEHKESVKAFLEKRDPKLRRE